MSFIKQLPFTALSLGFLLSSMAHGAVDVWSARLSTSGNAEYTVPSGKTLLIDHLSATASTATPTEPKIVVEIRAAVPPSGVYIYQPWSFPVANKWETVTLKKPLRVGSGQRIRVLNDGNVAYNTVDLQGLMVDNSDLYAAKLDVDVEKADVNNGALMAEAKLESPRPASVKSFVSEDLVTWSPNTSEVIEQISPGHFQVKTDADSPKKFLSIEATTR